MKNSTSKWFFIAAALVAAMQLVPILGLLTYMLGIHLFPILLNLGFVGVAIEANSKRIPRSWMLLPLLWFGGYAAFLAYDNIAMSRLRASSFAKSAVAQIKFDPGKMALVVDHFISARILLSRYNLPVVYGTKLNGATEAYRIGSAGICNKAEHALHFDGNTAMTTYAIHPRLFEHDPRRGPDYQCAVVTTEKPTLPEIRIARAKGYDMASQAGDQTLQVTTPEGTQLPISVGLRTVYPWIPKLSFSCLSLSGCSFQFLGTTGVPLLSINGKSSDRPVAVEDGYEEDQIARALGLKEVPLDQLNATPDEFFLPFLTSTKAL